MRIINKLGLGALGVIIITNPASGSVILEGLDKVFESIFKYGSPINFVASGVVAVVLLVKAYQMHQLERRINIPAKPKSHKILVQG